MSPRSLWAVLLTAGAALTNTAMEESAVVYVKGLPINPTIPTAPYTGHRDSNATVVDYRVYHELGIAPMSLNIPTCRADFKHLPISMFSIANQEVVPQEINLVISLGRILQSDTLDNESIYAQPTQDKPIGTDRLAFQSRTPHQLQLLFRGKGGHDVVATLQKQRARKRPAPMLRKPDRSSEIKYITDSLPVFANTLARLKKLRLYLRVGDRDFLPGNNRMFGCSVSDPRIGICSFFDSDDFMHPSRMRRLLEAFEFDPSLEVVWHRYAKLYLKNWAQTIYKKRGEFYTPNVETNSLLYKLTDPVTKGAVDPKKMSQNITNTLTAGQLVSTNSGAQARVQWTVGYEDWWNALPVNQLDGQIEPFEIDPGYDWYLFKDWQNSKRPRNLYNLHNGWQTVKKTVLEDIPYPDLPSGEDSLFNWRAIRAKRRINYDPAFVGYYVRP